MKFIDDIQNITPNHRYVLMAGMLRSAMSNIYLGRSGEVNHKLSS